MVEKLLRKAKGLLRKLFQSGQFIIWKAVGGFGLTKSTGDEDDWRAGDWRRILVIQLNAIGDLVMTTPALNCLRRRFPEAQIDALVRPHTREILDNNPRVNDIYTAERQFRERKCLGFTAIGNSINTIRLLKKRRYELSIDFSGQFSTAWISFLIGARHRLGLRRDIKLGWFDISGFDYLYTREVAPGEGIHLVDQNMQLLAPLGCEPGGEALEVFPAPADFDCIDKIFRQEGVSSDDIVVCLHPGAKWPPKRWPEENYGELIRRLSEAGCRTVLIGGGDEEIAGRIMACSASRPVNLAGRLSLLQTAALIKRSRLFIGNDSGPMHLAAAMGTPSVLFFGPVSPETTAPRGSRAVIFYKNTDCNPCTLYFTKDKCQRGENICLKMITVDEVWPVVSGQLGLE
jgi:predicted lipopolysaccharide heptosyltransferase III